MKGCGMLPFHVKTTGKFLMNFGLEIDINYFLSQKTKIKRERGKIIGKLGTISNFFQYIHTTK